MNVQFIPHAGGLALRTPYDPGFVAAFKATVPATARRWDWDSKLWLIDPSVADAVADLCAQYFAVRPHVPAVANTAHPETRILEVRYLGATKDRGGDDWSAFGYAGGRWSVLFPERVLREWFCAEPLQPGGETTLFGVLGVAPDADRDMIKAAYRRLARQWHPDVSKEPDAAEVFKRINEAYQTLSDDTRRRKYLAGLALEASLAADTRRDFVTKRFGYRAPLRCGLILADGTDRLGVFHVSKIRKWEDITAPDGRVLVTTWPAGAPMFEETWR